MAEEASQIDGEREHRLLIVRRALQLRLRRVPAQGPDDLAADGEEVAGRQRLAKKKEEVGEFLVVFARHRAEGQVEDDQESFVHGRDALAARQGDAALPQQNDVRREEVLQKKIVFADLPEHRSVKPPRHRRQVDVVGDEPSLGAEGIGPAIVRELLQRRRVDMLVHHDPFARVVAKELRDVDLVPPQALAHAPQRRRLVAEIEQRRLPLLNDGRHVVPRNVAPGPHPPQDQADEAEDAQVARQPAIESRPLHFHDHVDVAAPQAGPIRIGVEIDAHRHFRELGKEHLQRRAEILLHDLLHLGERQNRSRAAEARRSLPDRAAEDVGAHREELADLRPVPFPFSEGGGELAAGALEIAPAEEAEEEDLDRPSEQPDQDRERALDRPLLRRHEAVVVEGRPSERRAARERQRVDQTFDLRERRWFLLRAIQGTEWGHSQHGLRVADRFRTKER